MQLGKYTRARAHEYARTHEYTHTHTHTLFYKCTNMYVSTEQFKYLLLIWVWFQRSLPCTTYVMSIDGPSDTRRKEERFEGGGEEGWSERRMKKRENVAEE